MTVNSADLRVFTELCTFLHALGLISFPCYTEPTRFLGFYGEDVLVPRDPDIAHRIPLFELLLIKQTSRGCASGWTLLLTSNGQVRDRFPLTSVEVHIRSIPNQCGSLEFLHECLCPFLAAVIRLFRFISLHFSRN